MEQPDKTDFTPVSTSTPARRNFLKTSLAVGAGVAAGVARAATTDGGPGIGAPYGASPGDGVILNQRYPDPAVEVLDPEFAKYRIFNASVQRISSGFRWAEGPVWMGAARCLLVSDDANNRIVRWDEVTGQTSVYREGANFANGLTTDMQGRLLTCEGSVTRRISRTEHSGKIVTVTDNFDGKRYNSPNDIVCQSNGAIWFTDPPFQMTGNYEGHIAARELPDAVYRVDGVTNKVTQVILDINGPNGLCFSPDEKILYVIEGRSKPNRLIWAYDVTPAGTLRNKRVLIDAGTPDGAFDGIKCDIDGNIWAGWGSSGTPGVDPAPLDGVKIFNAKGKAIGHIHLPERCPNLCFGGIENNRLFMASSHSVYALYVNTQGAEKRSYV